jgi:hypothetical protein
MGEMEVRYKRKEGGIRGTSFTRSSHSGGGANDIYTIV